MLPEVSIIIVSWNTRDLLMECLRSVYEDTINLAYEVFVIDNASSDGTAEMVQEAFPNVILIKNMTNLGFAKANNQGIRECRGKYILLLNPDTVILDNAIREIKTFMDTNPMAGIATCKVLNSDKTIQVCYGAFPSLKTVVFGGSSVKSAIHSLLLSKRFFNEAGLSPKEYNQRHKVDWIMGAFMMVRKEVIEEVGMLDENLFIYGDEPDWCYRIRKEGWEIWYNPEAQIIHYGGKSIEQVSKTCSVDWLLNTQYYFFLKHYGRLYMILCYCVGLMFAMMKLVIVRIMCLRRVDGKKRKYIDHKINLFRNEVKWHVANKGKMLANRSSLSV